MAQFAFIVVYLALAGALASWIVGAWFYAQTLRALSADRAQARLTWLAILAWPLALGRLKGSAAAHAAQVNAAQVNAAQVNAAQVNASHVNKALVAFFACLTIAVAATSVATNLARVSR